MGEENKDNDKDDVYIIKILDNQNKLLEKQYDYLEKSRKMTYIIIVVFSILITLIVSAFMISNAITEKYRNNVKVENKAVSCSDIK